MKTHRSREHTTSTYTVQSCSKTGSFNRVCVLPFVSCRSSSGRARATGSRAPPRRTAAPSPSRPCSPCTAPTTSAAPYNKKQCTDPHCGCDVIRGGIPGGPTPQTMDCRVKPLKCDSVTETMRQVHVNVENRHEFLSSKDFKEYNF